MVAALGAVRRNSWASVDNAMLVGMSAEDLPLSQQAQQTRPA
jgi:hypothetical protein